MLSKKRKKAGSEALRVTYRTTFLTTVNRKGYNTQKRATFQRASAAGKNDVDAASSTGPNHATRECLVNILNDRLVSLTSF